MTIRERLDKLNALSEELNNILAEMRRLKSKNVLPFLFKKYNALKKEYLGQLRRNNSSGAGMIELHDRLHKTVEAWREYAEGRNQYQYYAKRVKEIRAETERLWMTPMTQVV